VDVAASQGIGVTEQEARSLERNAARSDDDRPPTDRAEIRASTGMFGPVPTQKIADLFTTAQIGPG
ncbi:MAG TPA: hypothetical protein VEQ67_11780, partial [Mycobacterium sp.]|nr:hypothetical protein [Mycobacterium sp.]